MSFFQKMPIEISKLQSVYLPNDVQKSFFIFFKNSPETKLAIKNESDLLKIALTLLENDDYKALKQFAKAFSIPSCIGRPSIRNTLQQGLIEERMILKMIYTLITDLCSHFEKKLPKNIKKIITHLYNENKDNSIEDFVKFFDLCKRRTFISPYQYITTRGITLEFILDWMDKYNLKRRECLTEFKKVNKEAGAKFNNQFIFFPELSKKEKDMYNSIHQQEQEIEKKILIEKLLHSTLIYYPEYFNLSEEEQFMKAKIYFTETEEKLINHWEEMENAEKRKISKENFLKIKLDRFINERIRIWKKNPFISLIKTRIKKIILDERIKTGEALCCRLLPDLTSRGCYIGTIDMAINAIISYKFFQLKREYIDYYRKKLSINKLPMKEEFYLKAKAWKWVCEMKNLNNKENNLA